MKAVILFLGAFFILTVTRGQTYNKFPEGNFVWNYRLSYYDGMPCMGSNDQFVKLVFGSDTVINSTTYHRLYRTSTYCPYFGCGPCYTEGSFLEDFIRQDTVLKKVYRYDLTTQTEIVLLDFDLTIGQIHPPTQLVQANTIYVSSIDSVLLGDTKYHNVYNFKLVDSTYFFTYCQDTTSTEYISLIEGVGFTRGFPYGSQYGGINDANMMVSPECMGFTGLPPRLVCFGTPTQLYGHVNSLFNNYSQKDSVYFDPGGSLCDVTLNTTTYIDSEIFLFPNPASEYLNIVSTNTIESQDYKILNLQGEIVLNGYLTDVNKIIDIHHLSAGLYLMIINSSNTFRFIKD